MKGLTVLQRKIVEKIRESKSIVICLDYGTRDELAIRVEGKCPHDVALAVQDFLREDNRRSNV